MTEAGHGPTWNNKLLTQTSGDLWLRPYLHLCTKRTKEGTELSFRKNSSTKLLDSREKRRDWHKKLSWNRKYESQTKEFVV